MSQHWPKITYADNRAAVKRYRESNKGKRRNKNATLKRYGLTIEEYDRLLTAQDGVCAICKCINENGRDLSVDHDHTTGIVRGLLCQKCNSAIGLLKDDIRLVYRAVVYLLRGIKQ
jgi:Recombination endonuclease VII